MDIVLFVLAGNIWLSNLFSNTLNETMIVKHGKIIYVFDKKQNRNRVPRETLDNYPDYENTDFYKSLLQIALLKSKTFSERNFAYSL